MATRCQQRLKVKAKREKAKGAMKPASKRGWCPYEIFKWKFGGQPILVLVKRGEYSDHREGGQNHYRR